MIVNEPVSNDKIADIKIQYYPFPNIKFARFSARHSQDGEITGLKIFTK